MPFPPKKDPGNVSTSLPAKARKAVLPNKAAPVKSQAEKDEDMDDVSAQTNMEGPEPGSHGKAVRKAVFGAITAMNKAKPSTKSSGGDGEPKAPKPKFIKK